MKGDAQERSVNQSVLRGGDESYDFSSYNPPKSKSNWVNRIKLTPNPEKSYPSFELSGSSGGVARTEVY